MTTPSVGFQDFFSTTLSGNISATDTVITLTSAPTPSEGFLVIAANSTTAKEIIYYTSKSSSSVTCPSVAAGRGVGGTSAQSHNLGDTVQMNTVGEMFASLQDSSAVATNVKAGWFPASASWTYASATTMTVSSADASAMTSGTKIWLSQSGSKYFYVTGISGTTITINGGSDYTLANAAITAPYFSNSATAVGFPSTFNFTPAWTNLTVGTGGPAANTGSFAMNGKIVTGHVLTVLGTSGPSVGSAPYIAAPVATASSYNASYTNPNNNLVITDASASANYGGIVTISTANRLVPQVIITNGGAGYAIPGTPTAGTPMTWANSDSMAFNFTYESL